MNMEQHMPKLISQSQKHNKEECKNVIPCEKEWLYLETETLSVSLGASLPKIRNRMWFHRSETPKNAVFIKHVVSLSGRPQKYFYDSIGTT